VQAWKTTRSKIQTTTVTKDNVVSLAKDFSIFVPNPLQAPEICAALLQSDKRFALLIPLDLLGVIALDFNGKPNRLVFNLLNEVPKLVFAIANQAWVLRADGPPIRDAVVMASEATVDALSARSGREGRMQQQSVIAAGQAANAAGQAAAGSEGEPTGAVTAGVVASASTTSSAATSAALTRRQQLTEAQLAERFMFYDDPDYDCSVAGVREFALDRVLQQLGPLEDWIGLQQDSDCEAKFTATRADGLKVRIRPGLDESPLIIVPSTKRQLLMELVHKQLGHNSTSMVKELQRRFYWGGMAAEVKAFCASCEACAANKRAIRKSHGLFRDRQYFAPRMHYSMDVRTIKRDGSPAQTTLAIIDRFSAYLVLVRMPNKRATSVISAIMTHVVYVFGKIFELTIDSEKGFESQQFDRWAASQGTRVVKSLGYSSTGNSAVERVWGFYDEQITNSDIFPGDQQLDSSVAWTWNIHHHSRIGFTPYEVQYGSEPTTALVLQARDRHRIWREPTAAEREELIAGHVDGATAIHEATANRGNAGRLERAVEANRKSGSPLPALRRGDSVMYYQPPSGRILSSRGGGRNRHYVSSFTGPAQVRLRLSNVGYVVMDLSSKQYYYRHRNHLRRVRAVGGSSGGVEQTNRGQRR
jgi:hypothetical protein